ncbi:MAG TPA: hypothetical protein VI854_06265 [Acidimicrobiia bacterium]|nr:hypothetical protein [Acidimicrobiia bacterium]
MRPKARGLSLELVLPRPVEDPRVTRRISISETRIVHFIPLASADDVDDTVRGWLTETFDHASSAR